MVSRSNRSEEYRQSVSPFLEEWAARGLNAWEQFRNWSVQQVLWEYGLSVADIEDATNIDGPKDKGIDAWYYDDADTPPRLTLVQAKDTQIERGDFSKLRDGFLDVILPNRPGNANQSLLEKAAIFKTPLPEYFKLDVYLTSSMIAQQTLQPNEEGEPLYTEQIPVGESTAETSYYVRDIKFLAENIQIIHGDPIEYEFTVDSGSVFAFSVGGHTRTVCAALKATEIAMLFDKNKENLFRKNPRYYLFASARNKEIKESLKESQNEDFFVYNNGLTCVAHAVRADMQNYRVQVSDFQIVNGCQTVASIWSAWVDGTDVSKVRVLAKIVENQRTGTQADEVSERIALRSNTQNPLKAQDWKANDRRQELWQERFRLLPDPWFYEIKRGVWDTEYRATGARAPFRIGQTRQYRKVSMKDLGQVCYAFLGYPAEAQDKSREIFNNHARYEIVFPANLSPSQLLLPYLIFQQADYKTRKETPKYLMADGYEIKTDYLRFAIVSTVGYMLRALAGASQGYFPATESEGLISSKDRWMSVFVNQAFDQLARKLASESRARATGPRSIVRRNDWMEDAIENAIDLIRQMLKLEAQYGAPSESSVSGALPFEVH